MLHANPSRDQTIAASTEPTNHKEKTMSSSESSKKPENLTRREFMQDSAATAAGLAVGLGAATSRQAHATEVTKTRSYNPQMKYRPLGKTGFWGSALWMGGG